MTPAIIAEPQISIDDQTPPPTPPPTPKALAKSLAKALAAAVKFFDSLKIVKMVSFCQTGQVSIGKWGAIGAGVLSNRRVCNWSLECYSWGIEDLHNVRSIRYPLVRSTWCSGHWRPPSVHRMCVAMTFGGALIRGLATQPRPSVFKVARLSGTCVHSAKGFGCKLIAALSSSVISPEFCDFAKGGCCVSRASSVRRGFRWTRIESQIDFEWWGLGGTISLRTKGYAITDSVRPPKDSLTNHHSPSIKQILRKHQHTINNQTASPVKLRMLPSTATGIQPLDMSHPLFFAIRNSIEVHSSIQAVCRWWGPNTSV
jgi:hypothetical protein